MVMISRMLENAPNRLFKSHLLFMASVTNHASPFRAFLRKQVAFVETRVNGELAEHLHGNLEMIDG